MASDWTPTDEQVEAAARAVCRDKYTTWDECEMRGAHRRDARATLLAVGPAIRAQAWREAAASARAYSNLGFVGDFLDARADAEEASDARA
ncbi:hypothetical protein [Xylanimonas protaetiae]|uniref:Uncharacterized protein n=1 Tax=Xylanimonas protaetiae TaxID=2509457 RepID=A0A4P6F354_9MICO|nr:hypothetical protein [Xylanimonas protaetiae]QAY70012.1 hypothetical protein ET471_08180 [Xylanimonas protaetiae]